MSRSVFVLLLLLVFRLRKKKKKKNKGIDGREPPGVEPAA